MRLCLNLSSYYYTRTTIFAQLFYEINFFDKNIIKGTFFFLILYAMLKFMQSDLFFYHLCKYYSSCNVKQKRNLFFLYKSFKINHPPIYILNVYFKCETLVGLKSLNCICKSLCKGPCFIH